jgi:hypothetical protein
MKRLQIYKSASDFAYATLALTDPLEISQKSDAQFVAEKFDPEDYPYWKQTFSNSRQTFLALNNQPAQSTINASQAAAIAARTEAAKAPATATNPPTPAANAA